MDSESFGLGIINVALLNQVAYFLKEAIGGKTFIPDLTENETAKIEEFWNQLFCNFTDIKDHGYDCS